MYFLSFSGFNFIFLLLLCLAYVKLLSVLRCEGALDLVILFQFF